MLLCNLLLTQFAIAGTPAHYSPLEITKQSERFAQSAEVSAPKMQLHQREMRQINKSLIELSLNAELLSLTDADHWAQVERAQIKRTFYESNTFIDAMQIDYNHAYLESMNRAITPYKATHSVVECSVSRVAQMAGKSAQCVGQDLTPALVEYMDSDKILDAALKEIEARPWPALKAPQAQMAVIPITGSEFSISPSKITSALLTERLDEIKNDFEDAIAPIESAIDSGSTDAIEAAKAHRKAYETEMTKLGSQVSLAVQIALSKSSKKEKKWGNIGYCAQPIAFGGCGTQDVSAEVIALIQGNKKAMRALE